MRQTEKSGCSTEEVKFDNQTALDNQAVRNLGNAKTVLWDIEKSELTERETGRLETIQSKLEDLERIVYQRVEDGLQEEP